MPNDAIVLRPSAEQADVPALRDAYGKMQALSASDNRSWIYWAELHGFNRYDCWHHARSGHGGSLHPYDLFLPWHRAYLTHWDHVTRDQNAAAILPWWDWTSAASHTDGIPTAYAENPDGNPLASGPMPDMPRIPARRTRRQPGDPAELPSYTDATPSNPPIDSLVALTDFRDLSNQLQDVHDFIHGWVGGDMGVIATSAFDPIFWAHHAMIDRIWYQWQLKHGVNDIPPDYLDKVLLPFGLTVQQVLDVRQLGYDYASSSASATPTAATARKART